MRLVREGRAREKGRLSRPGHDPPGQRRTGGKAFRLGVGKNRVKQVEEGRAPVRCHVRGGAVEKALMFLERQKPPGAIGEDAGTFDGRLRQGRRMGGAQGCKGSKNCSQNAHDSIISAQNPPIN